MRISGSWRSFSTTVSLRPYQEACLEACRDALHAGATRIGVSLPTGAGKTTVFLALLAQIPPPSHSPAASRALIIVNSVELARQAAAQAATLFPQWRVEIEQGVRHKASGTADVTVATYQTLLKPPRLSKFHPGSLKAVIVDEAHHAAAPSYRRILAHFDPAIRSPEATFQPSQVPHPIPIIGFSATFSRHDGLGLGSVFQQIVYHRDFLEMIKEQWLCDVCFTSVKADINIRNVTVNSKTGDFNTTSLAHVINTDTMNNLVVQAWLDKARRRQSTLVFCVNLRHVRALTKAFEDFGVVARYLHSGTLAAERHALIEAFKAGQFPVLVNCAILTEGADIPNIDCVVVARPTRSRNVFAQMIGRGMRQSPSTGKVDCLIIDFVDSTNRVAGVVSTPTLFGLDPQELIDNDSIKTLEARTQTATLPQADSRDDIPNPKYVTYVDYQNLFALFDGCSGAPHVAKFSTNAWVGCGNEIYILECLGRGYIRIELIRSADEDKPSFYHASFTEATMHIPSAKAFKVSPFMRKRSILTAETLDNAIRGCDTYASQKVLRGSLALGLLRTAKWRKAPATDSQKDFIYKRRVKRALDQTAAAEILQNMTKGEAASIITRLKHGAQAYHEKKMREANKAAQLAEKERRRKERETVQVGRLYDDAEMVL